ncbi:hypothetical protein BV20DRAFT_952437 [Pilatotrama ljubarskyi]|nr:hypothetical protein BV20DRAFT_952437 [Pilatotrama ljubarskyi]
MLQLLEEGHYKSECWAPGGGKEGQDPKGRGKQKDTKENTLSTQAKDEVWHVYAPATEGKDLDDDIPDSAAVSDSDSVLGTCWC